jgi:hypothetical protein
MKKSIKIIVCLFFISLNAFSQISLKQNDKYFINKGKEIFLNGVNYVPSVNWQTCIDKWDASAIEKDFEALEGIGVKCIRWFPLWPYLQPTPTQLDDVVLSRIVKLFDLAQKHHLYVQLSFMSGWMSGFTFLREWADGNIFTDPKIIEGEKFLIRSLASKLKNHPALQGYDFGNEMNVLVSKMNLEVTPVQIDLWMQTIYKTIHEADPNHPVTNGIGTGFDQYFNTPAIAKSCDYLSNHSYPVFHRTTMLDPKIGQRTTYSSNFITSWCKMEGKPVLIQEIGASEGDHHISEIAKFLRITMLSNWAEGAAGFFWWCSSDINPNYVVPTKGLYLNHSVKDQQNCKLSRFEESLGLFDIDRKPKVSALEYKKCVDIISKLGQGWQEQTPVCYVLVPEKNVFDNEMLHLITPFTLLKQNHVTVRMAYETRPILADASAVVISGFELSETGKKNVGSYLQNGGSVYQSYYNDFKKELLTTDTEEQVVKPLIWSSERLGSMLAVRSFVKIQDMSFKNIQLAETDQEIASRMTGNEHPMDWDYGKPIYVKTKVGKGNYFYFAGNLEKALQLKFNPWAEDDSNDLYSAFCPEHEILIDNKFVEFFHKKRGKEELILLINHENSFQDVNLLSKHTIKLKDDGGEKKIKKSNEFYFRLKPAEVKFLYISR